MWQTDRARSFVERPLPRDRNIVAMNSDCPVATDVVFPGTNSYDYLILCLRYGRTACIDSERKSFFFCEIRGVHRNVSERNFIYIFRTEDQHRPDLGFIFMVSYKLCSVKSRDL